MLARAASGSIRRGTATAQRSGRSSAGSALHVAIGAGMALWCLARLAPRHDRFVALPDAARLSAVVAIHGAVDGARAGSRRRIPLCRLLEPIPSRRSGARRREERFARLLDLGLRILRLGGALPDRLYRSGARLCARARRRERAAARTTFLTALALVTIAAAAIVVLHARPALSAAARRCPSSVSDGRRRSAAMRSRCVAIVWQLFPILLVPAMRVAGCSRTCGCPTLSGREVDNEILYALGVLSSLRHRSGHVLRETVRVPVAALPRYATALVGRNLRS